MNKIILTCKIYTRKIEEKIYRDAAGTLHIHIKEIPEKGKANKSIIKILSKLLKIPQQQITIIGGITTTLKKILIKKEKTEDEIKKNIALNIKIE
jgi:uncharacterized protein YggU (UPF0235/DUF167 family)